MAVTYISATALDLSAASGSTGVTVPTDATLAVVFWSGYATAGLNVSSMTLNTVDRTNYAPGSQTGTGSITGGGTEWWPNPATGPQTLAWTWTNTPLVDNGPAATIAFFKECDTSSPFRAGGVDDNAAGGSSNTLAIDSATTDYVIGFCASWQNTIDCAPASSGQTNLVAVWTTNGRSGRLGSEDAPGASSTTFTADGTDAMLIAVSIIEATGEPPAYTPPITTISSAIMLRT